MNFPASILFVAALACSACGHEVDDPFYLDSIGDEPGMSLIRCVGSPQVCAQDGLPGPGIVAAGANKRFIVALQQSDHSASYFYFERVAEEKGGWGNNPERIVGPLTEQEYLRAKAKLHLPDFTVGS